MDLRKFNLTEKQKKFFIENMAGYQPFRIDDNKQSIAKGYWPKQIQGYDWFYRQQENKNLWPWWMKEMKRYSQQYDWFYRQREKSKLSQRAEAHWSPGHYMVLDKNNISTDEWDLYSIHNSMHDNMFDSFINGAISLLDEPADVIEIGCNDGSLLLRALKNGCTSAIGYDMHLQHKKVFDLWKKVTDYDIDFVNESYDSSIHSLPECKSADFVIANAIICHLSDPLHFIKFLTGITNKVLLISCGIDNTSGYTINFHGKPKEYGNGEFPNVFTHHTSISKPLLLFALKECGFKDVYEIEHKESWPPTSWYYGQNNMGFIAVK
jgi:2-polyprenyl-3-methyl-5-hydroxy-6-metoxy-1,4-benzoquinol methylase